jgi:hypothetical protein
VVEKGRKARALSDAVFLVYNFRRVVFQPVMSSIRVSTSPDSLFAIPNHEMEDHEGNTKHISRVLAESHARTTSTFRIGSSSLTVTTSSNLSIISYSSVQHCSRMNPLASHFNRFMRKSKRHFGRYQTKKKSLCSQKKLHLVQHILTLSPPWWTSRSRR